MVWQSNMRYNIAVTEKGGKIMTQQSTDVQNTALGLCELLKQGALWDTVESYICECRTIETSDVRPRAKAMTAFPNLAGLCRYAHVGMNELARLSQEYPEEYDRLLAVFEDEALNADRSATILSAYLKKRLMYAEDTRADKEKREVSYCFEHDIYADGE